MTTDASRRAVFDTTELLESILVHLPPKNLFGALRVSKQFQTVITGSVSSQEKMFLRIRKRPRKIWLLKEARTKTHYVGEMILSPQRDSNRIVEFNPFLELLCQIPRLGAWNSLSEYVELTFGKSVTLSVLKSRTPSILDTYICNPISEDVQVTYDYQLPGGHVRVSAYLVGTEPGVKVQFKWLHSFHWRTHTDEHDSCLDTYFCDPPCRNITVRQQYIVKGEVLKNTVDIQMEKVATVHEVLTTALTQASWISGIRFIDPADRPMSMEAALKLREQANGCENRSQTVFSKAVFTLHRVLDPVSSG
jgi:hypothetical protein